MKRVFENTDFRIPARGLSLRWILADVMNIRYGYLFSCYEDIIKNNIAGCTGDLEHICYINDGFFRYEAVIDFLLEMHMLDEDTGKKMKLNILAFRDSLNLIIEQRKGEKL